MKRRLGLRMLWTLSLVTAAACGDAEPEDDAATLDPAYRTGRAQYRAHCSVCHGKSGRGAPRLFPPLRGPSWVDGNPEVPILIVLHGLSGRLTVGDTEYMNEMPSLGDRLNDAQIGEILTFVRASWGNRGGPVGEEDVSRMRRRHVDRKRPWMVEDLYSRVGEKPADPAKTGEAPDS